MLPKPLSRLPVVALALPGVVVGRGGKGDPRLARGLHIALDRHFDVDVRPATAGLVGLDLPDLAAKDHAITREHGPLHAELHARGPASRSAPVGQVALEPERQVRGVQEDVLHSAAPDREVAVVVHRPDVSARERPGHHGGRRDVVGQLRKLRTFDHSVDGQARGQVRHHSPLR